MPDVVIKNYPKKGSYMDTSEKYIKMCEKAGEIQKLLPGDMVSAFKSFFHPTGREDRKLVWLPRQDQLQEMNSIDWRMGLPKLNVFAHAICELQLYGGLSPESWEQLWLQLIMKEKFNKTWTGEDWVNA